MAAAYTSLVSLMNTVDSIQNHPRHSFSFDKKLIGYLQRKSQFFLEFIDIHNFDHGKSKEVEDLEIEIASAARLVEDVLESCVADQIIAGRTVDQESVESSHTLQTLMKAVNKEKYIKVAEKIRPKLQPMSNFPMLKILMDSLAKKVDKIKKEESSEQPRDFMAAASSRTLPTARSSNSMVGFDDYLIQLMDVLTGHHSARQIISVVGMGGIGKTTLARNVYEHMVIVEHFYIRAWATISQEENIKEILLELLSRRGESTRDTVDDLGEELYKKLSGSRYLIVLDDMWSSRVWDKIRFFFPDNGSRSRIVVTTRLSYVASYVSISSLEMDLLDEDKSWTLFCAKTFGDEGEDCPVELEETGKKIVEQCKGLPLSIVLIAGHLRKLSRTETQWMNVARSMISFLYSDEDQCLSILSLSYSHLPAHLKPCFLYMGTFPEDKEILVSTLIRLWVAEGFLRSDGVRSLEEIAQGYLKDLVERNLVSVDQKQGHGRKFLTCHIHDLLRELCLKVGEKEKFFCVLKLKQFAVASFCNVKMSCLICNQGSFCIDKRKLLRIVPKAEQVLNEDEFNPDCLEAIFQHINMRYIFGDLHWERSLKNLQLDRQSTVYQIRSRLPYARLPSSIFVHWNLQTLIIHGIFAKILAPSEIWEMPQLRHVDVFDLIRLPRPPLYRDDFVLRNLQTLLVVENLNLSGDVCRRIPNIKELEVHYSLEVKSSSSSTLWLDCSQYNLRRLKKLESLRCEFSEESDWRYFALRMGFPRSLKELLLGSSGLYWKDLSMIGLLPNLEVLTLISVKGNKWSPVEGEFLRLKSLKIYNCADLVHWDAERSHFPALETLTLGYAYKLREFPSNVGDIPTLGRIYLDRCSAGAAISAMRMLAEKEELGNDYLRLEIQFQDEEELECVRVLVQEEGLESVNLRLKYYPRFK